MPLGIFLCLAKNMLEEIKKDAQIIWFFLSKYKKEFYANFAITIISSALTALIPFSQGKIADLLVAKSAFSLIATWLAVLFFVTIIRDWILRIFFVASGRISINCVNDFVLLLNRHAMNLKLSYHNKNKSGKLSSRYIKAGDAMENFLESIVFWFAMELLMLVLAMFLIAFFVHWLLFAFMLIHITVYVYFSYKYSKPLGEASLQINKSYEEAYGSIHDSVANIKLVKANSKEQYESDKVEQIFQDKAMVAFNRFWQAIRKLFFLQDIISVFMLVGAFAMLAVMFDRQMIGVGQIVAFVGYFSIIKEPLWKIGRQIEHYRKWMATIRRGYSLLDEEVEDYEERGKTKLENVKGAVEFNELSFAYNETREVLHNINLKVGAGEMVAFVGESGVGKSTLMDLLSRYIEPTSGKIFIDSIDIQKVGLKELRKQIAIVPQEVSMFNDTMHKNILYGNLDASEEDVSAAVKAANMEEFLDKLPNGINEEVGERGVHLSGGQKQRVAIARAILKNPKILILDEATSALDSKSEALVQDALKKLIKNRTTFVIAHRLSTIVHADKIVVLDKGVIAEQGTHQELLEKKGIYYKLYTLQTAPKNLI